MSLATPAELKNPSIAKELHGQTESIAPIASERISGVLANREFGRSTTVKSGRRSESGSALFPHPTVPRGRPLPLPLPLPYSGVGVSRFNALRMGHKNMNLH